MKSAFTLASKKKHLFLDFRMVEKNMLLYGNLTCTMATAQGGYYRDYSAALFCIDQNGEYVWKVSATDTEKFKDTYSTNQVFQRQRNPRVFTMLCRHLEQKYKTYIVAKQSIRGLIILWSWPVGSYHQLVILLAKFALPKRSRHAKASNFNPEYRNIKRDVELPD